MKIKIIEHTCIKLSDGCHLAAKIWLPEEAHEKPVPAILEYIPYGKREGTALRDQLTHPYFAENGFACLRVDIRGSGESEGLLMDEYTAQELQDCCEVLKWIAQQSWCTGKVGMMGISWGGFNSLQVAALNPPELAAVISLCSTDDRYADDCHFMGGCLLTDNFQWSARMLTTMSLPPDPQLVGENWRERWLERLKAQPLLASTWLNHPNRDDYWKHGSVCEQYTDIQCPVYLISGWADGYSNTIPRMLEKLSCPRKGLIGPWGHKYPHIATPGPQIGFLQEAVRWWDKWLKGIENGIMEEPLYRVWLQNSSAPKAYEDFHEGRWVAVSAIPSPEIQAKNLYLSPKHKLTESPTNDNHQSQTSSPQSLGETGGTWLSNGTGPERPIDQQFDDCRSICYTSAPLGDNLAIWGAPIIELEVAVDSPQASIAVRLNEILPTGASCRISFGLLNLSHRKNDEISTPTKTGVNYLVQIKLNDTAHIFAKGSQIRIAISTAYWPIMWPSPSATTLSVSTQKSKLNLPIYLPNLRTRALPEFKPAVTSIPLEVVYSRQVLRERKIKRCLHDNSNIIKVLEDSGCYKITNSNLEIDQVQKEIYSIKDSDPLSARSDISTIMSISRADWRTRTESRSTMTSTEMYYQLEAQVDAFENDKLINTKKWSEKLPRSNPIPRVSDNPVGLFKSLDKKNHDSPDQKVYAKTG